MSDNSPATKEALRVLVERYKAMPKEELRAEIEKHQETEWTKILKEMLEGVPSDE
jgi:hypothetical protein